MKSLSLNNLWYKYKKNVNFIFFVLLIFLVIAEVFVLRSSVSVVLSAQGSDPVTATDPKVRVNFQAYEEDISRIQKSADYVPTTTVESSPFLQPSK